MHQNHQRCVLSPRGLDADHGVEHRDGLNSPSQVKRITYSPMLMPRRPFDEGCVQTLQNPTAPPMGQCWQSILFPYFCRPPCCGMVISRIGVPTTHGHHDVDHDHWREDVTVTTPWAVASRLGFIFRQATLSWRQGRGTKRGSGCTKSTEHAVAVRVWLERPLNWHADSPSCPASLAIATWMPWLIGFGPQTQGDVYPKPSKTPSTYLFDRKVADRGCNAPARARATSSCRHCRAPACAAAATELFHPFPASPALLDRAAASRILATSKVTSKSFSTSLNIPKRP